MPLRCAALRCAASRCVALHHHQVLDEVHERDSLTDFLLILVKQLLPLRYCSNVNTYCSVDTAEVHAMR
jgi:hypothetical protein